MDSIEDAAERTIFEIFLVGVFVFSVILLLIYCCTVLPFVSLPTSSFRKRRKENPQVYTVRTGDPSFHLRPSSVIADEQDVRNGINMFEVQLVSLEEIIRKNNDDLPPYNVGATATAKNDKDAERLRF